MTTRSCKDCIHHRKLAESIAYPDGIGCQLSNTIYYKSGHAAELCKYFKYRKKVLTPEISSRLADIIKSIGDEKGFTVVECRVGESDHVHCFVSSPPKISVTQLVKYLKGISGNQLFREYPELRNSLWRGELWNGSYFCETIGSTSEDNIIRYIERQKNCQL